MELGLLEALIYSIVSGVTEFLPVSSLAHQKLMLSLFGAEGSVAFLNLTVHIGAFVALLLSVGNAIKKANREYQIFKKPLRRRKREPNMLQALEFRLFKLSAIPMLLCLLFTSKTNVWGDKAPLLALFLVLNGILLFLPSVLSRGNKDARSISSLESILIGIGGGLSVLPGVSRIASLSSVSLTCGADTKEAYKWSLYLSVPAMVFTLVMDLYMLFSGGFSGLNLLRVLICLVGGCLSYFSANLAISLMKTLTANKGITGFSYYCWGVALFVFIIYLY